MLKKEDYEEHIKKHMKLVKNNRRMKVKIEKQKEELTRCQEKNKEYKIQLKQKEYPNIDTETRLMNIYEENKQLRKKIEGLNKEINWSVDFANKIWDALLLFNKMDLTTEERQLFNNLIKEMGVDLNDG